MEIASRPERRRGEQWLSLLIRVDASEIKALNESLKKFIQDAERTGTTDEINTKVMIGMQKTVHEARGMLNPS